MKRYVEKFYKFFETIKKNIFIKLHMIDIMIKNYRIIFILKYLTIQFFNTYIKNQKSFLKIKLFFF